MITAAAVASVGWHKEVAFVQSLQSDSGDCSDLSGLAAATYESHSSHIVGVHKVCWACPVRAR